MTVIIVNNNRAVNLSKSAAAACRALTEAGLNANYCCCAQERLSLTCVSVCITLWFFEDGAVSSKWQLITANEQDESLAWIIATKKKLWRKNCHKAGHFGEVLQLDDTRCSEKRRSRVTHRNFLFRRKHHGSWIAWQSGTDLAHEFHVGWCFLLGLPTNLLARPEEGSRRC